MKKNNKGFSLVELIVVILIMAILGVALTPQVMKWVNNSRISSDITNYNALVSACELALTNESVYNGVKTGATDYVIEYDKTTLTLKNGGDALTNADPVYAELDRVSPGWSATRAKVTPSNTKYRITIDYYADANSKVTISVVKTDAPSNSLD